MDFDLSDEQVALRDAARDLLDGSAGSDQVRAVVDGPDGYDAELLKRVVEQGWLALELPEADGGIGLGFIEVAVLAEQIGRHVAPVPYLSSALAIGALLGTALADEVPALVAGERVGCVGVAGELVVDAPSADLAVLVDGERLVAFPIEQRPASEPSMDRTRRLGWLAVPAGATAIGGADEVERLRDRASVAYAAEMLGASERMLEVATEYAKTREQFDRPIGSFQAIKHRLADMLVDVEGMRSAVYAAAWSVATDAHDRSLAASTAKSWAGEASRRVLESALQVHGGIGFTWEHDLHLYLKRAHVDRVVFGEPRAHLRRMAALLRERVAAGADLW